MKKIKYENKTIAYSVCKARIKNLYISIQNGEVVVKAPWYVTSSQIQDVVESKRDWIMKQLEKYSVSPLNVENGKINVVLPLEYSEEDNTERIKKLIDKMYYMIAEKEVENSMEKMRKLVGLAPNEYRIKKTTSLWGSCSSNKKITINQNLMMYDRFVIDYVVLHEICHLRYMNHSKNFWNMVSTYMPNYKEAEAELKK